MKFTDLTRACRHRTSFVFACSVRNRKRTGRGLGGALLGVGVVSRGAHRRSSRLIPIAFTRSGGRMTFELVGGSDFDPGGAGKMAPLRCCFQVREEDLPRQDQ